MSGLQMDSCVSSSGAHEEHFLDCWNPEEKKRSNRDLSLCRHTSGLSHATRGYQKTHARLNSVLEQALVTTAVGEAHC